MPKDQSSPQQKVYTLSTVGGLAGAGHLILSRVAAVSILAGMIGLAAGLCLYLMTPRVEWNHMVWIKLTQRGWVPYCIVGCFFYGFSYLLVGSLFRCFPRAAAVNRDERNLLDLVTFANSFPVELGQELEASRSGGWAILRARLSRLWNSFCRGADPSDLRSQNESLSTRDEANLIAGLVPLDISMWAMPVLGFIGTVIGAGDAVEGLSGAIGDVVNRGQLNTGTVPFFSKAFDGLKVAFDTTYVGLVGLIIVGFGRWMVIKSGTAAIMQVDAVGEDFISLVSHDRSVVAGFGGGGGGDNALNAPLWLLPNRLSRLALDTWRSGHDQSRWLEERVIEGAWEEGREVQALAMTDYPYHAAVVERVEQGLRLRVYRLCVSKQDGLFFYVRPMNCQETEITPEQAHLLTVDQLSRTVLSPLPDQSLGLMTWSENGNPPTGLIPLTVPAQSNRGPYIGHARSVIQGGVCLVLHEKNAGKDYVLVSHPPRYPGDCAQMAFRRHDGVPLACDPRSPLIAMLNPKKEFGIASLRDGDLSILKMFPKHDGITRCLFALDQRRFVALTEEGAVYTSDFNPLADGPDAVGGLKITSKPHKDHKPVSSKCLGVMGSATRSWLVYLKSVDHVSELWACDLTDGTHKLVLPDCRTMAVSRDGRYMVTCDRAEGLRVWSYRPEGV